MQWSDKDISRIEGKFDSFCKTVLRNFARDWYRAEQRHHATEVLFSELPDGQLFEPIHNDPICPLEQYLFDDLELPINITDDALAQALRQLSRRKRQIVLLAYFCDWTERRRKADDMIVSCRAKYDTISQNQSTERNEGIT